MGWVMVGDFLPARLKHDEKLRTLEDERAGMIEVVMLLRGQYRS